MQTAVRMPDGETRWLTEEERARIAHKYGPPHQWTDPNPRRGMSTTWSSYVPTPDDVRELDREAKQRQDDERLAGVREQLSHARAAYDRRRFLPKLSDAVARGIEEALCHRACPDRYAVTAGSRRWVDASLREIAVDYLTMAGDAPARDHHRLAMAWLHRGGQRQQAWQPAQNTRGYLSTSDLALLLDNTANTIFLDSYGDSVRSFASWSTELSVPDFRATITSAIEFPSLHAVPEHAEYVAGSPFGPAAPLRLVNFGRVVNVSRQLVLRDDLASFGQLQAALGVAAAHVENDSVYNLLTSNPTLADGNGPLFSTQRGNLLPPAAIDATALGVACAALAANSKHGRPAFLLVGTKDGPVARHLVWEETPPNAGDASGVLQVVVDDRIPSGFYVTTDPAERCALITAHLAGVDGPELLSRDDWNTDGRQFKARNAFGSAVFDPCAIVFTPAS
jgi:hypothetical protein